MCNGDCAAEKSATGAPEDEIEITPAMIEAGKEVVCRVWVDFTGPRGFLLWDEVLSGTFRAMTEARHR